ncbi:formate/nitrite transporter family protein [Gramella sp. AN32]|uniref:Formate/nitrite transporter family protein n=1 Tax=Christiangramia antarctica TaxID=2058158 RepID=A0ABW5X590_9FLAO|nr:formate/nitrite transporter family protein [Gramella sp. AN32]MCM4157965.1 formate dehydrogenase [Gramella sp. AN32]
MENRFLDVHLVVKEMSRQTWYHLKELTLLKSFILSVMAGAFITFGALFSVLISAGVETTGLALLLQGFGFSVGFFMVILSGALLFSETNVVLPASLLNCSTKELLLGALKFWGITIVGNVIGAFLVGWWINYAHEYPQDVADILAHIIHKKMHYYRGGDLQYWMQAVVSGMFGNWLVGMAAIFAIMGKTIIGKYIPIFLAVSLFVAANFQHSPANMGYFSLMMPAGNGPGWENAILWNLLPAALGNILGGIILVALPFWYALSPSEKEKIKNLGSGSTK